MNEDTLEAIESFFRRTNNYWFFKTNAMHYRIVVSSNYLVNENIYSVRKMYVYNGPDNIMHCYSANEFEVEKSYVMYGNEITVETWDKVFFEVNKIKFPWHSNCQKMIIDIQSRIKD